MDDAFIRRLQIVVEFPFPGEAERRRIWAGIFPREAPLAPAVDFDRLAREGMAIAVLDRNGATAQAAADEIGGFALTADVTSQGEVQRAVDAAYARFEKIDLLVNNAGIC